VLLAKASCCVTPRSTPCLAGAVLGCLVVIVGSDVLGYGAFGPVTELRDRTARLTQPTLYARFARAGRGGDYVGVGCVKAIAGK